MHVCENGPIFGPDLAPDDFHLFYTLSFNWLDTQTAYKEEWKEEDLKMRMNVIFKIYDI